METQTIASPAPAAPPPATSTPDARPPQPVRITAEAEEGRRLEQEAERHDLELIAGVER